MRNILHRLVFVWTTIASVGLFGDGLAEACVCQLATCGNLTRAASVIEATVESIEAVPGSPAMPANAASASSLGVGSKIVRLRDVKAWRGEAPTMLVTGAGGGDCGYEFFRAGTRYLIETNRLPGGGYAVSMCSLVREIQHAQPLLEYLKALNDGVKEARVIGTVARITGWPPYEDAFRPVKGAEITLSGPRQFKRVTDEAGGFDARGLPPGAYSVSARVDGAPLRADRQWSTFVIEESPACVQLNIQVPATGRVAVAVLGDDGAPMPGAFVYLQSADHVDRDGRGPGWGLTLPEGQAVVPDIPPGRYMIAINPGVGPSPGSPYLEASSPVFVIEDGKTATPPPLRPRRATKITVSGVVRDGSGAPLPGVVVDQWIQLMNGRRSSDWPHPTTDAEGRFDMQLWKDQPYVITVGPERDPWGRIEFVADGRPIAVTARPR